MPPTDSLRERLRSQNADSSLLNTSQNSLNRSAFEDKQSPVCRSRYVNDNQRLESSRVASLEIKIKWHLLLLAGFLIDHFVLNSAFTSFLLLCGTFSSAINSAVSLFISTYSLIMVASFTFEVKFPHILNQIFQKKASIKPSEVTSSPASPKSQDDHDLSWVDSHKFGTPAAKSFLGHQSPKNSPMISHLLANTSVSDTSGILGDIPASTSWKSPSAYRKSTESIHTRKQLDVLLRSQRNEAPVDLNAPQSYFSSIWNVFDMGRGSNGGNDGYQLSEEVGEETNPNSSYRMKIGKSGRTEVKMVRRGTNGEIEEEDEDELTRLHKIMSAAKNATEAKATILKRSNSIDRGGIRSRRRSHSSPERGAVGENEMRFGSVELLTEEQQKRAEFRTRAWIRNTIIQPLVEHIAQVNKLLEKEHANPPLRVGVSTVDALKLAAIERDSLKSSDLPFLLPFLNVHQNQAYLVSRVRELAASQFMDVYKWNSGGAEPTSQENEQMSRLVRREWNDQLPTDAVLVFDLFSAYMDAQLNSNVLVGDNRLDQPFTSQFTVRHPRKPTIGQRAPYSFYLHLGSPLTSPHIEFVHIDANGSASKSPVLRQNHNLFRAIAQFVHYVKEENHGYLDQTAIGRSGINLTIVLL